MSASPVTALPEVAPRPTQRSVNLAIHTAKEWSHIEPQWRALADSSPYRTFYLSADWTGAWLETFGELLQPEILLFEERGACVGACLLIHNREKRGPFHVSRLYLNTAQSNAAERPMMEFNSVLCRAGWELKIADSLGAHLQALDWNEFVIEGMRSGPILDYLQTRALPHLAARVSVVPSYYVDLERLRRSNTPYEKSLSSNTREQLRRGLRRYSSIGPIEVEVACDFSRATDLFEEMRQMHQSTWTERGQVGALDPQLEFHRTLMKRAFANGGIHLLRVSAGGQTLGVLYNFIQDRKVYFFQSGFNYKVAPELQPGLVTHACAIYHYLEAGYDDYDFLAGDARYKRSLAKDFRNLAWIVFARPSVKLTFIDFLRAVRRRMRFRPGN